MQIKQFLRSLRKQKIRTLIPVLGITWGTVAIVVLLGLGKGMQDNTSKAMHGIGENIAILFPGRTTKQFKGMGKGKIIRLRDEDATLLQGRIPYIKSISPEYSRGTSIRIPGKPPLDTGISGVYPEWGEMRNIYPQSGGRFINENDLNNKRRVVFLGDKIKEDLFKDRNAVGEFVSIEGVPFLVIGVMQEKIQDSSYYGRDNERIVIPVSTYKGLYSWQIYASNFIYNAFDPNLMETIKKMIYQVLGTKYKFDPEDNDALHIWDTTYFEKFLNTFLMIFRLFLVFVATLTLIVGGIGVASIMNILIEEREREIGIKMAVGAHRSSILLDILTESLFLSGMGGIFGFILSFIIFKIVNSFHIEKYIGTPVISVLDGMIAFSILLVVSLIAGYFPARRAAWMNPIDSIR